MRIWPGEPYPLGASYDGSGTNFSVFSEVAEKVELCLFDEDGRETRVPLPEVTGFCWHAYLPEVREGQRYGIRVYGPWDPSQGLLCNPNKLLLDPYARAVEGGVRWNPAVLPYRAGVSEDQMDVADSAPYVPRSVVINPYFDWSDDVRLRTPAHRTIIYEMHVKGFTATHPDIPSDQRGTYAGIASPPAIEYLKELGVTAVELMPVHQFLHDERLVRQGLRNYWGYNSIGFLAPHNEYAAGRDPNAQVNEFKHMVRTLHQNQIEVILDVVYNHTAEGNGLGPMLSFRGLDNVAYYRLDPANPRNYVDYTGCGNSLNMRHPQVLQLIMDSLRYWIQEMHVDGFRFDLAAALARELHDVDRLATFFDIIQQDPVIRQVKLIAEPWDVGEGGYQIGNFPPQWSEWNGKYRDTVRDYWRGVDETLAELAYRFTGSSDLYEQTGRRPHASVNFVTAHDGFTLRDLVSYERKHNEDNLEDNKDGTDDNRSWNCGVEGPTRDPGILELRGRQQRNFLATLFLSQGIPMLLFGDETGRTQNGNNNAYCQDNELGWMNWGEVDEDLLDFTRNLVDLVRKHGIFSRRHWFLGRRIRGTDLKDIVWFNSNGRPMSDRDWAEGFVKCLGVFLNGRGIAVSNRWGEEVTDDSFYVLFNGHSDEVPFQLPPPEYGSVWERVFGTEELRFGSTQISHGPGEEIVLVGRSMQLLRNPLS